MAPPEIYLLAILSQSQDGFGVGRCDLEPAANSDRGWGEIELIRDETGRSGRGAPVTY